MKTTRNASVTASIAVIVSIAFAGIARIAHADNPNGVTPYYVTTSGQGFLPPLVDTKDRVYVAGPCKTDLVPTVTWCDGANRMLVRLSPKGAPEWAVLFTAWGELQRLSFDGKSHVVLEGTFNSSLFVGADKLLEVETVSGFRLVFDAKGAVVEKMVTPLDDPLENAGPWRLWSPSGELFVSKAWLSSAGRTQIVARYPSTHRLGWRRGLRAACDGGIALLPNGHLVLGCRAERYMFDETLFGPSVSTIKDRDPGTGAVVALDEEGRVVGVRRFDGEVLSVGSLADGSVVVMGAHDKPIDIDGIGGVGGPHQPAPGGSTFVTVLGGL